MSYAPPRARNYYSAQMPQSAWKGGRAPRERRVRRMALADLSDGLERYLKLAAPVEEPHAWARWALRLGADVRDYDSRAPDGSSWWVKCRVEI